MYRIRSGFPHPELVIQQRGACRFQRIGPRTVVILLHERGKLVENRCRVSHQARVRHPVPVDLMRIDVYPDNLHRGRDDVPGLEYPVESKARCYDNVRLSDTEYEAEAPHVHDRVRVIIGELTSAVIQEHEGDAGLFDECFQHLGTVAESHTASANEQRLFCVVDNICSRLEIGIIRMHGVFPSGTLRHWCKRFFYFHAEDIGW